MPDVNRIICGNAMTIRKWVPDESVHCVVTSPPYYGLRDYGIEPQVWGGEPGCAHEWGREERGRRKDMLPSSESSSTGRVGTDERQGVGPPSGGHFCRRCGAWRGNLGLEPTPELYVEHLVAVFREVRRVLRKDGTAWVNMGDCYASQPSGSFGKGNNGRGMEGGKFRANKPFATTIGTLKAKNIVGMPWRLALALQADGWTLRSDIIEEVEFYCPCGCGYILEERIWRYSQDRDNVWKKPNPMPDSVQDRPTKSHEYVFLFSKSARYFYDQYAVREQSSPPTGGRQRAAMKGDDRYIGTEGGEYHTGRPGRFSAYQPPSRNLRSVWTIATWGFPGAHFATFPEALVEPCIKAGTSQRGCCPECGAPWVRVVERSKSFQSGSGRSGNPIVGKQDLSASETNSTPDVRMGPVVETETIGWRPTCEHVSEPVPCLVLDPFMGAGTVALVARKLGRDYLGIELKPEYIEMAERRLREAMPLFAGGER